MSRTRPEDFPSLVAAIDDVCVRALFGEPFLRATEIFDEMVDAACWSLLEELGALPPPAGATPGETAERLGLAPRSAPAFAFLHEKLADAGWLSRSGGRFFPGARPPRSVDALAAELASAQPAAAVGGEVVTILAAEGAAFFRGEKSGEEILFAPTRLPLWFRYFSNDNLLYTINNTLGAEALSRALANVRNAVVLEVGGGCGSAAELAIRALDGRLATYRFSEVVPTFLRRGERAARAAAGDRAAVESFKLDMTKPWPAQGVAPESVDAVYSVNCFHVAPDLQAVLREARAALRPGGAVVVSECVRPTANTRPIYVEFVFDFLESFTNVRLDPATRPNHGFLTPSAWRASFRAAGFGEVTLVPDVDAVAARYPSFFVGSVIAR